MMKKTLMIALFAIVFSVAAGEKYSVLVFGDTHYDSMDVRLDTKNLKSSHRKELKRNLKNWKENVPLVIKRSAEKCNGSADFAVQLGDLTQGDCGSQELQEKSFRDVLAIFQKDLKMPFHVIKGNHDVRGKGARKAFNNVILPYMSKMLKTETQKNGTAHFAVMHKGDLYIYFDCMIPTVNFVYETFKKYPESRYTFFLTHIPVLPCSTLTPIWIVPGEKQRAKFLAELAKRNTIVLTAHTHQPSYTRYKFDEGSIVQFVSYSLPSDLQREYEKFEMDFYDLKREKANVEQLEKLIPFFKPHYETFVRHRYSGGFNVLNVSDKGVTIDLYTGDMKKPINTVKLR